MAAAQNVHVEVIDDNRKNDSLKKAKWSLVGQGVILLVLGVICLVWPGIALATVTTMVGIGFLISGIASIAGFAALGAFSLFPGWALLDGVVNVLLGILFLMHPLASAYTLLWLIATLILVGGVMQLVSCWRLRKAGNSSWGFVLFGGVLTVILGILVLSYPALVVYYLAFFAILYGIILIVAAFKVRKIFGW